MVSNYGYGMAPCGNALIKQNDGSVVLDTQHRQEQVKTKNDK